MSTSPARVAVITGGSQGLGRALALRLARAGCTTVLIARTQAALDEAATEIAGAGGTAFTFAADVSDAGALRAAADAVAARCGEIDFLIINAGIVHVAAVAEMPVEQIRETLDVNLFGAIMCAKLFTPLVKQGGRVLFISSGFGLMGAAGYAAYNATKAGVITFAAALRRELHRRRIGVHVAVPGDIATPGFTREQTDAPAWARGGALRTPLPADVVAARILHRCAGTRFLVFSDAGVRVLHAANRFLPTRLTERILDALFPRP